MRRLPVLLPALALLTVACTGPAGTPRTSAPSAPAASPTSGAPDDGLRVTTAGWSTDFTRYDVPLDEIIGGGPGKDGIPAIDEPKFLPVDRADWLVEREPVIAVGIGDDWRAYPIQILIWHEIVNDVVADTPVTITFCPLCHTAIAFDRTLDGRVLDFGTTGNLRHSDLVMYDRQTESWWQQATGRAIVGELTGTQLEFLPVQLISWGQFVEAHPDGAVLSRDTGHPRDYDRNPYPGYDVADSDPFLLGDKSLIDGRLSPKVRILGLVVGDEAAAYPFPFLAEHPVLNDEVGGEPIVVVWADGAASGLGGPTVAGGEIVGAANAFSREVDGRTLTFETDAGLMRDVETGSAWTFEGRATAGELEGTQLQLLVADSPFWFAWAVFRPDTRVWQP
ncbi:MAG: DUF3179 domain-containing protein [Chloroflexi bacterium]|nr:DUF3179 domain-containing protein [Chloroflexota bacterium]